MNKFNTVVKNNSNRGANKPKKGFLRKRNLGKIVTSKNNGG